MANKKKAPTGDFEANGVVYKFTYNQFRIPGFGSRIFTKEELLDPKTTNEKALATLVERNANVITKVGEVSEDNTNKYTGKNTGNDAFQGSGENAGKNTGEGTGETTGENAGASIGTNSGESQKSK